jgi:hypothetical protein
MLTSHDLFQADPYPMKLAEMKHLKEIRIDGVVLKTTPVFDAYWYFATERQSMFRRRLRGQNSPKTSEDWILASHRFTNTYRASDRVSQYLIKNVIWDNDYSKENLFFRTLLFKIFNRIDTWEAINKKFGQPSISSYDFKTYNAFLSLRQSKNIRNYSAAYIMPSAGSRFGFKLKHSNHLKLIEWMLEENYPDRLSKISSMKEAYGLLLQAPSIGPFLAYQFVTDLNYSNLTDFSEMEFVVAGPGALDGISKCFIDSGDIKPEKIIKHMAENQTHYFNFYGLDFPDLWGRPLQLIDCQNIFCEISKYSRAAFPEIAGKSGRTRIKQKYKPSGRLSEPWYPPDWQLNEKIKTEYA